MSAGVAFLDPSRALFQNLLLARAVRGGKQTRAVSEFRVHSKRHQLQTRPGAVLGQPGALREFWVVQGRAS